MFKLLKIGDAQWVSTVMSLGKDRRDIHLDQRMLASYVAANKWQAFLALTETPSGFIVEPILSTPEGELSHSYNFGGPTGSSDLINSREHTESLREWAEKHDFRSKYITLIPFLAKNQLKLLSSSGISPEYRKDSVIIDLNNQKIRGTTRRLANKAHSVGVRVNSYSLDNIKHFIEIYNATMDRVSAKEHWYFSPKWFECFARFVKPHLLLADYLGKFEAGCLIVYSQQYPVAYYHFAGSYNNYPKLGINHMMVLAACEYIRSIGIQYLYLGGGITDQSNDSLLLFKSGFSTDRLPVFTYKQVYNVNSPALILG